MAPGKNKTILQCDFDGTITVDDVSFLLLDKFAEGDWRKVLNKYREDKLTVGEFNRKVFSMVKATRQEMTDYMQKNLKLRTGLPELVRVCEKLGLRFVIVSNGLDFYIEQVLKDLGLTGIEFHAAETVFDPAGMKVRYVSPDGKEINDGFKEAYMRLFLGQGYRTIYIGNGYSDFPAASLAHKIYGIDSLLEHCQKVNVSCRVFNDLKEVAESLQMNCK
jgi:2-hydroxy-3-keto-5-methylthiopentenyl-1-phosphate phosphatase